MYETSRLLASQSYQHWVSQELFSTGWFVIIGVLTVVYIVWFKLVDKNKLPYLLLLGSLCAVGFGLAGLILEGYYGLWEYRIRLFPLNPSVFITSYTIGPILFMLIAQYTSSWKSYLVWGSVGTVVITFVLMPQYAALGIIKLHNFNHYYGFILYMTGGIIGRAICRLIISIRQSQIASNPVTQPSLGLQPSAAKLLPKDNDKED